MHRNSLKESHTEKITQGLICLVIGVYPLITFNLNLGAFRIQSLMLFLCSMGALLYCFLHIRSRGWKLRIQGSRTDLAVAALVIYACFQVIYKAVKGGGAEVVTYDFELMILSLSALYLLIESKSMFQEKYFDVLLFSSLLIFACLLIQYVCWDGIRGFLAMLGQTEIASYTLLVCIAGLWQYCRCKDKLRSGFYLGVLAVGFLVLFINQNRVSIWLMVLVFLALPVWERTTAELVKRDMQVCFVYLFMLCNMSLLTGYTPLFIVDVSYDLEHSVYLELLIAIGGLFFFKYWDRIPEGVDLNRLIMRKMRRGYQFLLGLVMLAFVGIVLGGEHWKALPDRGGAAIIKGFAVPLAEEVRLEIGGFPFCFEKLGLFGGLLLLIVYMTFWSRLQRRFDFARPITGILLLIAQVFLVQSLFWKASINSLPIYWVFIIYALYYKEEREKASSIKIKFEEERK